MNNDKSILIIDDEVQIRKLLTITLEMHNYKVIVASNAKEGLAAAAMFAPSTILLDLGLPDTDGQQVLSNFENGIPTLLLFYQLVPMKKKSSNLWI